MTEPKTFVISDLHFGHKRIYKFEKEGQKVRDFAKDQEEGDLFMVDQWNSVVGHQDKVYIVGDLSFDKKTMPLLKKMRGYKYLVKGNHDNWSLGTYTPYFNDILGAKVLKANGIKVVLTHIPIHESCLDRWTFNIHGHTHHRNIDDPRYINVSVEQFDAVPQEIELLVRSRMIQPSWVVTDEG